MTKREDYSRGLREGIGAIVGCRTVLILIPTVFVLSSIGGCKFGENDLEDESNQPGESSQSVIDPFADGRFDLQSLKISRNDDGSFLISGPIVNLTDSTVVVESFMARLVSPETGDTASEHRVPLVGTVEPFGMIQVNETLVLDGSKDLELWVPPRGIKTK